MAVKEIKDMGASVLTRLKKQAKETRINYQTCLQLFAQEEFHRKLEMSRYAENFVLKGGIAASRGGGSSRRKDNSRCNSRRRKGEIFGSKL